jgi:hypothetical protein
MLETCKKNVNNKIFKIYMQTNSLMPQPMREIRKQRFSRCGSHKFPSTKFQSHLRSIHVISTIDNMEGETYHFKLVPTLKS